MSLQIKFVENSMSNNLEIGNLSTFYPFAIFLHQCHHNYKKNQIDQL